MKKLVIMLRHSEEIAQSAGQPAEQLLLRSQ